MPNEVNLKEYIHPKMDILFLALNAPEVSNANAHWFSRNLNFWNILLNAGIISERILDPLEGDVKVFGSTAINVNNIVIGVTDLNRDHVETNSGKVITTKEQVERIIEILNTHPTKKLCIMHAKVAAEFIKQGILAASSGYGDIAEYKNTRIYNVPFHNASIVNKVDYYKTLIRDTAAITKTITKKAELTRPIRITDSIKSAKEFYLPEPGNSITEVDIKSGTLRITVAAKVYFSQNNTNLNITIGNKVFDATYTSRDGRSDLLRVGRLAIDLLGLKAGGRLKVTKVDSFNFIFEKA